MMTFSDIEQIDPELAEGGRAIVFYAWTADPDVSFVWSISLPMVIEEPAFLVEEWREVGWQQWMQQHEY